MFSSNPTSSFPELINLPSNVHFEFLNISQDCLISIFLDYFRILLSNSFEVISSKLKIHVEYFSSSYLIKMELPSLSTNPNVACNVRQHQGLFCVTLCHTIPFLLDKPNFFQSLKWPKDLTILLSIGLRYTFLPWLYRKCPDNCQHRVQLLIPLGLTGLAISLRWFQSPPYHRYGFHHLELQLSVHTLNHWDWSIPLKWLVQ